MSLIKCEECKILKIKREFVGKNTICRICKKEISRKKNNYKKKMYMRELRKNNPEYREKNIKKAKEYAKKTGYYKKYYHNNPKYRKKQKFNRLRRKIFKKLKFYEKEEEHIYFITVEILKKQREILDKEKNLN